MRLSVYVGKRRFSVPCGILGRPSSFTFIGRTMKRIILIVLFIVALAAGWFFLIAPVSSEPAAGIFTIPKDASVTDVASKLKEDGYIKNDAFMRLILTGKPVTPGGYRLDASMNAITVYRVVTGKPQLVWVTIGGCLRKEQIGEMIGPKLGWKPEDLTRWNGLYNTDKPEWAEGVYYPDTYLLPTDEPVEAVARRFIDNFNAKFAPYADKYVAKNIKWTTGLKIASLISREAAGPHDMPTISGVIWNRLDKGMKLEIDATMQYTRGKDQNGSWWGAIDLAEKRRDSPYNTYVYKGLPPGPICSPGIDAIAAALDPAETPCVFYLHDRQGQIHCAETYKEHLANIDAYLR